MQRDAQQTDCGDTLKFVKGGGEHGDVVSRRARLRRTLSGAAAKATPNGSINVLQAVVKATEDIKVLELNCESGLHSALEFVAVMDVTPGEVFRGLLDQLCNRMANAMRTSRQEEVEAVLAEMLRHASSPQVRDCMVAALLRLAALSSSSGSAERDAVDALAASVRSNAAQLDLLPSSIQQLVWEQTPDLFLQKIRPLVTEYVRAIRARAGPLMDVRQKAPEARRREDVALQELVELVSSRRKLYLSLRRFLLTTFRAAGAANGVSRSKTQDDADAEPSDSLLRLPTTSAKRADGTRSVGEPVSIGVEAFLGTLRTQLLMSLIDRRVLKPALSGSWSITSEFQGGSVLYSVTLVQRGDKIEGTSQLGGITAVEGSVSGSKLSFVQRGALASYICTCEISQDMLQLTKGAWRTEAGAEQQFHQRGTFSGVREGPLSYCDSDGQIWDDMAHLLVNLDRGNAQPSRSAAAGDASIHSVGMQQAVRGLASVAMRPRRGDASMDDLDLVLADPCIVATAARSLVPTTATSSSSTPDANDICLETRAALQLLLCQGRLVPDESRKGGVANAAAVAAERARVIAELAEGPPSASALTAVGLQPEMLVAAFAEAAAEGALEVNTSSSAPTEAGKGEASALAVAVRRACEGLPKSAGALQALRLLLNTLANRSLALRRQTALVECLRLATVAATALQETCARSQPDCLQRQLVDVLVSTSLHLGDYFDAGLRRAVTSYLFPLAARDAWTHCRTARLLAGVYRRPNFVPSREEISAVKQLLGTGREPAASTNSGSAGDEELSACTDAHFDWSQTLAEVYISMVQGKGYLVNLYERSHLGLRFPIGGSWFAPKPPQAIGGTAEPPPATTQASEAASTATLSSQHGVGSVGPASARGLQNRGQAQRWLSLEDGILTPQIGDHVREFLLSAASPASSSTASPAPPMHAGADGEAANAVDIDALRAAVTDLEEILANGYRGYHWLCHLTARWIQVLERSRFVSTRASQLLRNLMRGRMVEYFDADKADQVLATQRPMPQWLGSFIQVPEWRAVVYELVKRAKGPASSLVSCLLRQISDKEDYESELQMHGSSTSNFIVFCRTLRGEISRLFMLLKQTCGPPGEMVVADICRVCSSSEYTYVYAQAILHQAMRLRPQWSASLRHVSQRLSEAASQKSGSVLRLDLRFTPLARYPDIQGILHSMCRFGRDIRVVPNDVIKLCMLLEELLDSEGLLGSTLGPAAAGVSADGSITAAAAATGGAARSSEEEAATLASSAHVGAPVAFVEATDCLTDDNDEDDARTEVIDRDDGSFFSEEAEAEQDLSGCLPDSDGLAGLLSKSGTAAQSCAGDRAGTLVEQRRNLSQGDDEDAASAEPPRSASAFSNSFDEGPGQSASVAGSRDRDLGDNDDEGCPDDPERSGVGLRFDDDAGTPRTSRGPTRRLRAQQSCAENSEKTASIFHMQAVSSRGAANEQATNTLDQAAKAAAEEAAHRGALGVIEALRRPQILEALLARFVEVQLDERAQRAFARLLALITCEFPAASATEPAALQESLRQVRAAIDGAECELERVYYVTHQPQHSWLRRLACVSRLQRYAIASMAGLRWLEHVVFSRRLSASELLRRMSQGLVFLQLRRAVDAHPRQGRSVLRVLEHMLDLLPNLEEEEPLAAERRGEDLEQEGDEGVAGDAVTTTRGFGVGDLRMRIRRAIALMLVYIASRPRMSLGVLQLVQKSMETQALDIAALRIFMKELLGATRPPYSATFALFISRLLLLKDFLPPDPAPDFRAIALNFCQAYRSDHPTHTRFDRDRTVETLKNLASFELMLQRSPTSSPCSDYGEVGNAASGSAAPGEPGSGFAAAGGAAGAIGRASAETPRGAQVDTAGINGVAGREVEPPTLAGRMPWHDSELRSWQPLSGDRMERDPERERERKDSFHLHDGDAVISPSALPSAPPASAVRFAGEGKSDHRSACAPAGPATSVASEVGNPELCVEQVELWDWWSSTGKNKRKPADASGRSVGPAPASASGSARGAAPPARKRRRVARSLAAERDASCTPSSPAPPASTRAAQTGRRGRGRGSGGRGRGAPSARSRVQRRDPSPSESSSEESADIAAMSAASSVRTVVAGDFGFSAASLPETRAAAAAAATAASAASAAASTAVDPPAAAKRAAEDATGARRKVRLRVRIQEDDVGDKAAAGAVEAKAALPDAAPAPPRAFTLKELQGHWRHSNARLGAFVVRGDAAYLGDGHDGRLLGKVVMSPDGSLVMCGYVLCNEDSTLDSIVWRSGDLPRVVWSKEGGGPGSSNA
eukprot:TRINITY_DN13101_c0_g1_i1.p1 TRINITY_DN13101_c0_g1~~TRINITY_DN13101_c0_g1_i1.p1  ORF type:complete len:2289 (-),score=469.50 TRINITY_DN13101_c0_g1_i1:118-6984(-)